MPPYASKVRHIRHQVAAGVPKYGRILIGIGNLPVW
jgi:hypothetical protein